MENPVYKPVISFSYGILNFHGDVKNLYNTAVIGNHAARVSISTFLDRKNHYYVGNFTFMTGKLSGNGYSYSDLTRNLNFNTGLSSIGMNLEYRFGHLIAGDAPVRPYVSLGLESINFSAKGDLLDADGRSYHYWSDGTIRDIEESSPGISTLLYRDYEYETDLRLREELEFGLGDYNQRAFSIPAGLGVHFRIDPRAFFSLGVSYHYALTDMIDNVAYEGTSIKGRRGMDSYFYSHITLHFDLFSDPATRTVDLMYADADYDPLFFDDEDGDYVLDVTDRCPGTPLGVAVDTLGCPLDGDNDMVPDYLDLEPNSRTGAWVNDLGETVSEEDLLLALQRREIAMARENVAAYMEIITGEYSLRLASQIPEQYRELDIDQDGYLSFEELLKVVDQFFDYQGDLTLGDLRELNEFFFSQ